MAEISRLAYGCSNPEVLDEMHFLSGKLALRHATEKVDLGVLQSALFRGVPARADDGEAHRLGQEWQDFAHKPRAAMAQIAAIALRP